MLRSVTMSRGASWLSHCACLLIATACGPHALEGSERPSWLGGMYKIIDPHRDEIVNEPLVLETYTFDDGHGAWRRFERCESEPVVHDAEFTWTLVDDELIVIEVPLGAPGTYAYGPVEIFPNGCGRLGARSEVPGGETTFVAWETRPCDADVTATWGCADAGCGAAPYCPDEEG